MPLDFDRVEAVNRSFISDELRAQESDMVFRVPFRVPTQTCEEVIVYLLIEHQTAMRQALLDALTGLRDLQTEDPDQYTRAVLYLFLLILHRRPEAEQQDLFGILTQDHTQNTEIVDMAASIIEISEQRGLQQGIQQGIKQGEIQGKQEALLKLLQHRFQNVPEAVMTRVRALHSPVELDVLFERSLTAESLEELQ